MNVGAPSPAELKLIQAAQLQTWLKVNAKAQWTDSDFQDALFSQNEYKPEKKEWFYSLATLEKLAFDSRTPKPQAKVLQGMIIQYQQQKTEQP